MSAGLFLYPKSAYVGRILPKKKIYENASISASIRQKFVDQIDKITWQYKLAPETVNLAATDEAPEIQIFTIALKTGELHESVLRTIDNAVPRPMIYELTFQHRVKVKAAYKRPSEADSSKWVTDLYFETDWFGTAAEREPLPVALDLGVLYERILRGLGPEFSGSERGLSELVITTTRTRQLAADISKLDASIAREKQFNRKIEFNRQRRELQAELDSIIKDT